VLDQTKCHEPAVEKALQALHSAGRISHVRLAEASIPAAMNEGLARARTDLVLYVDDDVAAEPNLVEAHISAHRATGAGLVAGRVIQPWEEGVDFTGDTRFHFASTRPAWVEEFVGCNFSVDRKLALEIGGFDENFVNVAYNYEAEFAYRHLRSGRRIHFEPAAVIHHLKIKSGGTRTFGEHLRTARPDHSVGAYYYIFRTSLGWKSLGAVAGRAVRSVRTRHHFKRPWWIPFTLVGELRGLIWAVALALRGPRLINPDDARLDAKPR